MISIDGNSAAPEDEPNMAQQQQQQQYDADHVLETFQAAAEENQLDPLRDPQVIMLPAEGELWIAGDIHDHRNNFRKITTAADLGRSEERRVGKECKAWWRG